MFIFRKPRPNGREIHTLCCIESGVLLYAEIYEGKDRMQQKDFVQALGVGTTLTLRCTKHVWGTGRLVILDSAFASFKTCVALLNKGLFMIGNVKTAHREFPKMWLKSKATVRNERAFATTEVTLEDGNKAIVLAAADMDKAPMTLVASCGTTIMAEPITRRITINRADGISWVESRTFEQMDVHAKYRSGFNAVDKHNAKRQGDKACLEDTWKTHTWWVRDYQMLVDMTVVNAVLLWRQYRDPDVDVFTFKARLAKQMMCNKWLKETREVTHTSIHAPVPLQHKLVKICAEKRVYQKCRFCGNLTPYMCACCGPFAPGATRGTQQFMCGNAERTCFAQHCQAQTPQKRKRHGNSGAARSACSDTSHSDV
jgi:hypothetical protein